jgi:hypothetical protein
MGRSKTAHIKFLEKTALADIDTEEIKSADLIHNIRNRRKSGAGPSTANNDIVWLRIILRYARAAWEVPFDLAILDNAYEVLKSEKLVAKSRTRSRRPTQAELEDLTDYFRKKENRQSSFPMSDILRFAIRSARRQSEMTSLLFDDNDNTPQQKSCET